MIYRYFAQTHGWTPEQVGRLTPAQIDMLLSSNSSSLRPRRFASFDEAFRFKQNLKKGT